MVLRGKITRVVMFLKAVFQVLPTTGHAMLKVKEKKSKKKTNTKLS